ncbi:MAG: thiamine pyrophosphate-binding protein [Pseudomonadales bacterium]
MTNMNGAAKALHNGIQQNLPAVAQHTYSDLIVEYLARIGVEYVFGIQGGAIEPFFDALARRQSGGGLAAVDYGKRALARKNNRLQQGPAPVFARHEAGAAFMADGYARETGKLAVCCGTTGPGSTNLLTGVASAYADRIPMLVITPQTALPSFGRMGLQESSGDAIDVVGMFQCCTRYNSLVSHPSQLESKLISALVNAFSHPRGPVHLSIPLDILKGHIEHTPTFFNVATQLRSPVAVDEQAVAQLGAEMVASLKAQRQLVFLIGDSCGEAIEEIMQLAETVNALIVTTPAGKQWVDAWHPQYRGVFGWAGHASASAALARTDVDNVIAIGTGLGEIATSGWDSAILNDRLIHIENCAEKFTHSPMAYMHVFGNLKAVFRNLLQLIAANQPAAGVLNATGDELPGDKPGTLPLLDHLPPQLTYDNAELCLSDAVPLKPQRLMHDLAHVLPNHTRFLLDAGNAWCWGLHYLQRKFIGNVRTAMGYGSMAWAIGASVGTSLGSRKAPTVCITGDGSMLMSGQELTVAVEQSLPVLFIVLNDQSLGMVKHGQRLGGGEQIGQQLPAVDFATVAIAMGANGISVKTPDDLGKIDFAAILNASKPTVLDVYIDPEEVPPMGERLRVLQ